MPRDGDTMNKSSPGPLAPAPFPKLPARKPLRLGRRTILLSSSDGEGPGLLLAFAQTRGGVEVWRSIDADVAPLTFIGVFPGRFGPRAVANLLASGQVGPSIDGVASAFAEVDGVDERWSSLLRLAWSRVDGKADPRVAALLRLDDEQLDEFEGRTGCLDGEGVLDAGDYLVKNDGAWLQKWRPEIEAEVERRVAKEGPAGGEHRRTAQRAFIEQCLLVLGRLPRPDESETAWDGGGLGEKPFGQGRRRRLKLLQSGRVRRFRIRVVFWTGADTYGYSDFGAGPGWYWIVRNPDPDWRFSDPMGPYKTPEEAWSDAACLEQDE
jgi:hypothetical protein